MKKCQRQEHYRNCLVEYSISKLSTQLQKFSTHLQKWSTHFLNWVLNSKYWELNAKIQVLKFKMWVLIFQIWVLIFQIWVLKWIMTYMGIGYSIFWSINEEEFKEWHPELISTQTTLFMAVSPPPKKKYEA